MSDVGTGGTLTRDTAPRWRNRIVGHGEKRASEFVPHPLNWRTHPAIQRAAMSGVLAEVGWVQDVVVNRTTGNLLDGHLRVEMAADGDELVPYVEVELSESEERMVLATMDPIAALAEADASAQQRLRDLIDTSNDAIRDLIDGYGGGGSDEDGKAERIVGPSLLDRFVVPPFSVLDSRQGYWQERKRRWLSLGIRSELGRGEGLTYDDSESVGDMTFYYRLKEAQALLGEDAVDRDIFQRLTKAERDEFTDLYRTSDRKRAAALVETAKGRPVPKKGGGLLGMSDGPAMREVWNNMDPGSATNGRPTRDGKPVGKGKSRAFNVDAVVGEGGMNAQFAAQLEQRRLAAVAVLGRSQHIETDALMGLTDDEVAELAEMKPGLKAKTRARALLGVAADRRSNTRAAGRAFNEDIAKGEGRIAHVTGTSRLDADRRSNVTGAPPMPAYADIGMANAAPGTSIFDPVLCELAYRWFSPMGGTVLDPFAGGSVRGIVAALLGRRYVGVDLSAEQIEANRAQAEAIVGQDTALPTLASISDPSALTPVERHGEVCNAGGSLPMRAAKQFSASRKLGRTHQELLIFVKGDPRKATAACGQVEVDESMLGTMEVADDG